MWMHLMAAASLGARACSHPATRSGTVSSSRSPRCTPRSAAWNIFSALYAPTNSAARMARVRGRYWTARLSCFALVGSLLSFVVLGARYARLDSVKYDS